MRGGNVSAIPPRHMVVFMKKIRSLSSFLNRYLTLFVILTTGLAVILPGLFIPISKVKILSLSVPNVLLAVIMFGTGLSIKSDDMLNMLKSPKPVIIGVAAKYLLMSVGAYLIAKCFQFDDQIAFGLVLLGCMPLGTASGVMVLLAGGEVPLSVAITIVSTLLAPVLTPVLTFVLGGEWVQVDFWSMFTNIMIVVLIPIVCGIFVGNSLKEKCESFKPAVNLTSIISLLLIVAVSTAPNKDVILSPGSIKIILAIVLNFAIAVAGCMLLARLLKLNRPKTSALLITSSEQNSGLSVGIAAAFSDTYPLVSIPSIIAVSVNVLLATALSNYLGLKSKDTDEMDAPKAQR